jgi:XTP/dITP diphosphohydrolase
VSAALVLATGNPGKVQELRAALAGGATTVHALADLAPHAPPPPPEDAPDYAGNAAIKARHAAAHTGLPALADDSGLEVDALGGRPGVRSARYGGPGLDDAGRVARLLQALDGVPDAERGARFVAVLALATPDGTVRATFEGRCEGRILHAPDGEGGFGYDPIFFSRDLGRAFGVAAPADKRRVSHRARALAAFTAWWDGPEGRALRASPSVTHP